MASAYRLSDRYFIHPSKRTTAGLWIAQPDFVSLPLEASPEELGLAVVASLAQSTGVVPHPTVWTGLSKPRLAAAGFRSEKAFMQGAHLVSVALADTIILDPNHNGGTTGEQRGFTPLPDKRFIILPNSAPMVVGSELLAAFKACTNAA